MSRTPTDNTRASLLLRLKLDGPAREVTWAEFYELYAPIIAGFGRRMGARAQEAEDLVQDVLKAFFCASPEFSYDPQRGRFRGYLKTCVRNKLRELRRRSGPATTSLEIEPSDERVESAWEDVWETEKLHRALQLTRDRYATNADRQRTFRAFEMCTLLGRSTEEVAAELQLTVESVRQAKSRVSRALRQSFEQLDQITG